MKILIIGSNGSTGKRYSKILSENGNEIIPYDIEEFKKDLGLEIPSCDKAIIACPTKIHYHLYFRTKTWNYNLKPNDILIEKPVSDKIENITGTYVIKPIECKMVCNWAFVFPDEILYPGTSTVYYNYLNTGKEGYWFDTCQLHILSNGRGQITNDSPQFNAKINDRTITKKMIEKSYERMICSWLNNPDEIWNVQDLIPELSYIIRKHDIENGQI
jgi:hypothetical protein